MNKRRALCVGNNYPATHAELNGCQNDAWDWSELLTKEGYEVTVQLEADRESVLAKLRELVAASGFGDRVVFTFSGHGTWLPDKDGDEADGRDEALVMTGLSESDLITDDELQQVFGQLRYGAGALVLSDSCHSGTVSRFTNLEAGSSLETRPRFISPAHLGVDISVIRALELEANGARNVPRRSASLISGCADPEYSWDGTFGGRPNGAFTRAAIDMFMHGISLNHWFQAIRQILPTASYPQTPQLSTTAYRKHTRAF